jgi:hypothetical protein
MIHDYLRDSLLMGLSLRDLRVKNQVIAALGLSILLGGCGFLDFCLL